MVSLPGRTGEQTKAEIAVGSGRRQAEKKQTPPSISTRGHISPSSSNTQVPWWRGTPGDSEILNIYFKKLSHLNTVSLFKLIKQTELAKM